MNKYTGYSGKLLVFHYTIFFYKIRIKMNIYTFSHVFYGQPFTKIWTVYTKFVSRMRRYSVRALNGLVKESPMQGGCQLSCTFRRRSSSPVTKALSSGNHTLR